MNMDNTGVQNRHIAKSNINRFHQVTKTEQFKSHRCYKAAEKAFQHMPNYGKGVCNGKS